MRWADGLCCPACERPASLCLYRAPLTLTPAIGQCGYGTGAMAESKVIVPCAVSTCRPSMWVTPRSHGQRSTLPEVNPALLCVPYKASRSLHSAYNQHYKCMLLAESNAAAVGSDRSAVLACASNGSGQHNPHHDCGSVCMAADTAKVRRHSQTVKLSNL